MSEIHKDSKGISIVIPVLNEAGNISVLLNRINKSIQQTTYEYEVIIIDDHSTDNTDAVIAVLQKEYPLKYFKKKGKKGKAQSLLQGFEMSSYNLICMIDSDLQYPPEALPHMLQKIESGSDVVVTRRKEVHSGFLRKFVSKSFNYIFCKLLHGLDYDVQSGFKIFRKEIVERISLNPLPWSFDLEFLLGAQYAGYKIDSEDIVFEKRTKGESKINILSASFQIGLSAVILKIFRKEIIPFHENKAKKIGQGFNYKQNEFIHYSDLQITDSAFKVLLAHQLFFLIVFLSLFTIGLILNWQFTLTVFVGFITIIYFADLLFNLYLILKSLVKAPEIDITNAQLAKVKEWPIYTIFCPLYKEWQVVEQFVKAIEALDYPKDKLQVQLLLEEDDKETINHVKSIQLPSYFDVIIVPDTQPKTKPKACNYGLRYAIGEYAVIYDAEDMPDKLQLKKAVVAFKNSGQEIACIQAKLNYYNRSQNILTRLFTAEYSLWFDLILTGLQSLNAPIPLGGTSNHFKVTRLKEVKGWDSFNVTEDCDLGIRLAKKGYQTAIIASDTLEEANSDYFNWINQRSRWIKGYMQTYLVHMRNPFEFLKGDYKAHFFTFQLVVGGKILSLFINPFMWITTILYFSMRSVVGETIESFFPPVIFYLAVFSLVFGNFLYIYYYMIGCIKRKQYDLVKFVFMVPFYWVSMSFAAWKALFQLIFKPHYWQKTKHGLHLKTKAEYSQLQFQNDIPQVFEGSNLSLKIRKLLSSGGILIMAGVIANILNYLYNGYLTRTVSVEEFGLISLVSNFLFLMIIPLESLSSSIVYRSAYYLGKYQKSLTEFWKSVRHKALIGSLVFSLIWILATPWLADFFKSHSLLPFYLFTPAWIFNTLLAVDLGFLTGNHKFTTISLITFITPLIKNIVTVLLVSTNNIHMVYAAIPISILISSLIGYVLVRRLPQEKVTTEEETKLLSFPKKYFFMTALTRFSLVSFLTLDVIIAKHFLSPTEAGKYALIALVGKMIFFVGGLFNQFIVPFVSKESGISPSTNKSFKVIFIISCLSSWTAYIVFGLLGEITGTFLLGNNIKSVAYLLPLYGFGVFAFSIASSIISYHIVKKSYLLATSTFILSLVQLLAIYIFHDSISHIVEVMAVTGIVNLIITLILHFFYATIITIGNNTLDFLSLLIPLPKKKPVNKEKLRILIFNWRDTKHVWTGGAETYIHGIAKQLVLKGHVVTVFCGNDGHSRRYEEVDGVQIIRRGGFFTVYVWAFLYYILRLKGNYDVVIDSVNGVPFFTPLYVGVPVVGIIHHVHQEVFRENLPWVLARIACFLEADMMPLVYKKVKMITVSNSTRDAMHTIGFKNKDAIQIVYPGLEATLYSPSKKTKEPTILYLGRLKKYKSIHIVIESMIEVLHKVPNAKLIIAGFGEYRIQLEELVKKRKLEQHVFFIGRVSEKKKISLLGESWVFVQPSFMEGWGITAVEASASGTVVIASDVPGLRESVKDGETGFLVKYGNVSEFSAKLITVLQNSILRKKIEANSVGWALLFTWEKSTDHLLAILKNLF